MTAAVAIAQTWQLTTQTSGKVYSAGAPDALAPSVPGSAKAVEQAGGGVLVSWLESTDERGMLKYEIRRGVSLVKTLDAYTTGINPDGTFSADANTSWLDVAGVVGNTYTITAYDIYSNTSVTGTITATSAVGGGSGALDKLMDFSDGTFTSQGGRIVSGDVAVVSSPVRKTTGGTAVGSNYSLRCQINKNSTGFGTSGLKRANLVGVYQSPAIFVPIWYGWSIYFPNPWPQPDYVGPNGRRLTTWDIISQFHAAGEFVGANPTCSISGYPNNDWSGQTLLKAWPALSMQVLGTDLDASTWSGQTSKIYQTNKKFQLGTPTPGRWSDFVMRVIWDYRKLPAQGGAGIGHIQLWMDGVKYVDEAIQNCWKHSDGTGPYWSIGPYMGWDITTNTPTDSVYANYGYRVYNYGEFAMQLESAGGNFALVDPATRVGARA